MLSCNKLLLCNLEQAFRSLEESLKLALSTTAGPELGFYYISETHVDVFTSELEQPFNVRSWLTHGRTGYMQVCYSTERA
jgi:hypothetical protein